LRSTTSTTRTRRKTTPRLTRSCACTRGESTSSSIRCTPSIKSRRQATKWPRPSRRTGSAGPRRHSRRKAHRRRSQPGRPRQQPCRRRRLRHPPRPGRRWRLRWRPRLLPHRLLRCRHRPLPVLRPLLVLRPRRGRRRQRDCRRRLGTLRRLCNLRLLRHNCRPHPQDHLRPRDPRPLETRGDSRWADDWRRPCQRDHLPPQAPRPRWRVAD
jgi:hypothetical protein